MDSEQTGFAQLGLSEALVRAVDEQGYEAPTPVQSAAIPPLLEGRDVLGIAATGTGKTAAFSLPMLQRITELPARRAPRGLVVVPTRELALQVARAVHTYGRPAGVRVLPIYGGAAFRPQLRGLSRGVDVVVATPGRALDHLQRGTLRLDEVACLVLDEADEMLDMGFQDEIEALVGATPETRQTALFSATFPKKLRSIGGRYLNEPVRVEVERSVSKDSDSSVLHLACIVRRSDKPEALVRILDVEGPEAAIVFCRTRDAVDELNELLSARGYRVEALHGGYSQVQRERVLKRFRGGGSDLLIATDVAARGIDVSHLTHVVNFDLPGSAEQYVHRVGRTGRAGRSGTAVSLVTRRERRYLRHISEVMGAAIELRPVPRVADLRRHQLRRIVDETLSTMEEFDLGAWESAAVGLIEKHEAQKVVAALLRMAHSNLAGELPEKEDDRDLDARGGPQRPPRRRPERGAQRSQDWAPLWIDVGRMSGTRPGDLVGAVTGESGISGRDIGGIHITDRYSVVEVTPQHAQRVLECMQGVSIRGRKVRVRPYRSR